LVRGGDQDGTGGGAAQRLDVDPLVVDRDGHPDGASGFQQREGAHAVRVLDGQRDGTCLCERADDQVQALESRLGIRIA
jgi:hypothetical protein